MNRENYPAKYIYIRSNDKKKGRAVPFYPSPANWFYDEKSAIKKHLKSLIVKITNILDVRIEELDDNIKKKDEFPFPIVIEMQDGKIAKSHRPNTILNKINSEVIAAQDVGITVISCTIQSLEEFKDVIYKAISELPDKRTDWLYTKGNRDEITKSKRKMYQIIHELTCIKNISIYDRERVLENFDEVYSNKLKDDGEFKVRFFNYDDVEINTLVFRTYLRQLKELGITRKKLTQVRFTNELIVYSVPYVNNEVFEMTVNFPGIERVSQFVYFESKSSEVCEISKEIQALIPKDKEEYPKVAIVDSGISEENRLIQPWVLDRDNYVIKKNQNNYHGDFVSGILNYGFAINDNIKNLVDTGVRILDVTVMPDSSKEKIREDDLLDALEQSLEEYSDEFKVWNLSLSSNFCCNGIISEFTAAIDELQKKYKVIFVIAAGNDNSLTNGRITLPADSMRGITVGAISLDSNKISSVEQYNIVPYSRKGPGVGLSIKPDVVHFSGNPNNFPILSVNEKGKIIGDYGTSFSTPLVSGLLAEYYTLYGEGMNPILAKALLVHGAKHPITDKRVDEIYEHYEYGFGLPKRIDDILYGDEFKISLVIEGEIDSEQGTDWICIEEFPFPQSLVDEENTKISGDILVTMVYDTPLSARFGSEYCRCNLDVKLRTAVSSDKFAKITSGSTIDNEFEYKWEKDRMLKESKWGNVKQVHFNSARGKKGTEYIRLEVQPNWRDSKEKTKIKFATIVTINDPKKKAPVYNEISRKIASNFPNVELRLKNAPTRVTIR